tara:strand:- start:3079 stop:4569 length:1491 start_codon:yes stop_codon:yes gene_type:complete
MEGGNSDDADIPETMVVREPVAPNVPDLLRVSPMDTTTATDVETSILDPVVSSDSFCRFVFLNKGILHSHSKITLAATCAGDPTGKRFFPLGIGVQSLISRCALKVGTKTLQEIDGYNYLSAYKDMFINNEHQLEREQVQSGKCISHEFRYSNASGTEGGAANNTSAPRYGLENGRDYNGSVGGPVDNLEMQDWANASNSPVFQIALSDMFPMLKQTQLPLYMMEEQVSVELTFEPASKSRLCVKQGVASSAITIVQTEVKLIADYIYYPQEMMDAYRAANNVISFNHFDYRHSKVSVSAVSTSGTTQIRNLGGAGRIVTKVITGIQADSPNGDDETILNQYHSISPERHYSFGQVPAAANKNGSLTVNIKYNDRFLYPIDITNPARQFHNTAQAEGMVPFVTREEFCAEGVGLTDDTYEGYVQNTGDAADEDGILGRFNWLSYRLNRNERINSRGLEYYWKYEGLNTAGLYTQRTWLELAKLTTLSGGFVSTALA